MIVGDDPKSAHSGVQAQSPGAAVAHSVALDYPITMIHRGILVGVIFGLLASWPGQASNLSNLLLDAIAVRFRTPPYIMFPLYEGEAIRYEDIGETLAEGRGNRSLTERQCLILAVYAFNSSALDDVLYYVDRTLAHFGDLTAIALEIRGYCYEFQNDWPAAAKAWRELSSEDNPDGKWSLREAFTHLRMNHVQQARRIVLHDDAVPKGHGKRNFILGYCLLKMGEHAGSWDPRGARWAGEGGRVYTTALGALCLEVYYRYSGALNSFGVAPDIDDLFLQ